MGSNVDYGERGRMDQIIWEFFVKSTHIILQSRSDCPNQLPSKTRSNRWFNLDVEESETARSVAEPWRKDNSWPLVIEVYLEQPKSPGNGKGTGDNGEVESTLIEQWVLQYEKSSKDPSGWGAMSGAGGLGAGGTVFSRRPSASVQLDRQPDVPVIYKRTVILLRSLYSLLRLLPGHRLYRACKRNQGTNAVLKCRTLAPSAAAAAISAFSASSDEGCTAFQLTPVCTAGGKLCAGVTYRQHTALAQHLEAAPPPLPRIICNYVNSPTGPIRHHQTISGTSLGAAVSGGGEVSGRGRTASWQPGAGGSLHGAGARSEARGAQIEAAWDRAVVNRAAADKGEEAKGEEAGSAGGLAGAGSGIARHASAPVSIPQKKNSSRRPSSGPPSETIHSSSGSYGQREPGSGERASPHQPSYWPGQAGAAAHPHIEGFYPASAPSTVSAAPRQPVVNPGALMLYGASPTSLEAARQNASLPPHPSHRIRAGDSAGTSYGMQGGGGYAERGSEASSSSAQSSHTISCSPNLPFAFTPRQMSSSSVMGPDNAAIGGTHVSPPLSGNAHTSSALVLARRPSWSPSSSLNAQTTAVCSISPVIIDSASSSLVYSPPSILPNSYGYNIPGLGTVQETGVQRKADMQGPLRLTFKVLVPPPSQEDREQAEAVEDPEQLPFALDGLGEGADADKPFMAPTPSLNSPGSLSVFGGGEAAAIALNSRGSKADVAAGALIQMLHEAPPLRGGPSSTTDSSPCTSVPNSRKNSSGDDPEGADKLAAVAALSGVPVGTPSGSVAVPGVGSVAPGSATGTPGALVGTPNSGPTPTSVLQSRIAGAAASPDAAPDAAAAKQELERMGLHYSGMVTMQSLSMALEEVSKYVDTARELDGSQGCMGDMAEEGLPEGGLGDRLDAAFGGVELCSSTLQGLQASVAHAPAHHIAAACGGDLAMALPRASTLSDNSVESSDETMPFIM